MEKEKNNLEEKSVVEREADEKTEAVGEAAKKKIKLSDYLKYCVAFENDPTEENEMKIKFYLSDLVIKGYLPMKDKMVAVMNIMRSIEGGYDASGNMGTLELAKVQFGLFAYCDNLENDISFLNKTIGPYDDYYQYGLVDQIMDVCKKDYDHLEHMVDESINIANIEKLCKTAQLFDDTEYDKWITAIEDLKTTLTPDVVAGIAALSDASSEENMGILREVEKMALKEADQKAKDEEAFLKKIKDISSGKEK